MRLNQNYLKLGESYLFAGIAAKVRAFKAAHPNEEVISLGIGDVTRPLAPAVICALQAAAHEMAEEETFRGYGPEQGYDFLREAIAEHYSLKGVALGVDAVDQLAQHLRVKVDVRHRREQALQHEPSPARTLPRTVRSARQADKRAGQLVLQAGDVRRLTAHARATDTGATTGGLLALKAEHRGFHCLH